jgi:thiosulfate/3-mercaptopyruvate sulfurtransferase
MLKPFLIALALSFAAQAQAAAPRDALLVSPSWLADHKTDRDLVILHVGTEKGYQAKHIPGARLVDLQSISVKSPDGLLVQLPAPAMLQADLERLGVSDRSHILVYSETSAIARATRVMLTLDAAGLGRRSSLLDGGLSAWEESGGPTTTETPSVPQAKLSPLKMTPRIVTAAYVQAHRKDPGTILVDARATEFYDGEKPGMEGQEKGHIPGAVSIPFTSVSDSNGRLKSPDALKALFAAVGAKPGDHVIAYCHIGIQATAVIFAARTLGIDARLYDGSFQDWSNRSLPVEPAPAR